MSKHYDPERDPQRQDYNISDEIEPYNTMDIETALDVAFGNCTKKPSSEGTGEQDEC